MRIEDFPRPRDDNGRGLHWSTLLYNDAVTPSIDHWVDQLRAMKIKWLKVLDDGGGSAMALCRKLVAADIMPVIRFYFPQLNPHRMSGREMETVSRYVEFGVRYFEANNEPDLPAEWRNNSRPFNWLDVVVENFIRDADGVLARGGLLALPPMGPGSSDNPVSLVVQKGRRDLFENGCWVAIHNYTLNHPLDYPDDPVNQTGQPVTQAEYDELAAWAHSDLTYDEIVAQGIPISAEDYGKFNRWGWDGRPREIVNETRARNKNPGATILDDANCFRGFEAAGKMIHDALGFYVPVISTEGGAVVGWGDDNRYAKMNPTTHKEAMLEITRFMQSRAPAWYFACCTWLIASKPLGDFNPTWDQMSWYTDAWNLQFGLSGQVPAVQALKDEPSQVRPELQTGTCGIHGTIRRATGQAAGGLSLRLVGSTTDKTTASAADGKYLFDKLGAGVYRISSGGAVLRDNIELGEDQMQEIDLTVTQSSQSRIEGTVRDSGGQPKNGMDVTVGRAAEQLATVHTNAAGHYAVENLPAGSYWVYAGDWDAAVAGIVLDGFDSRTVDLTVPAAAGKRFVVVTKRLLDKAETGNRRMFYGVVHDETDNGLNGVTVQMFWPNAQPHADFPTVVTPKDHFKAAGNFEFLHSPGEYMLKVVDPQTPSDVADGLKTSNIPGREGDPITWEVNFQRQDVGAAPGTASVDGEISNAAGLGLTLWQGEQAGQSGARSWATVLPADGSYFFEALPAGTFTLELEGHGAIHQVVLAAGEVATFDYQVGDPAPTTGALEGTLTTHSGDPAPGQRLLLLQNGTQAASATTDAQGKFRFAQLQPGLYRIDVEGVGTLAESVSVAGGVTGSISLALPEPPATTKPLARYMLLPATPSGQQLLDLLLPYVRAGGITTGVRLSEAMHADAVDIVGGEDVVSADEEQALRDGGSVVTRLPADPFELAEVLHL
ncbi:MAG: carboxypeptidase regulatory-like domain-containing protein [Anaerolineales bacterium]|nr:carboxypeptidase regulatory-like domain-containing protein [Anaerolineales bacterium]